MNGLREKRNSILKYDSMLNDEQNKLEVENLDKKII